MVLRKSSVPLYHFCCCDPYPTMTVGARQSGVLILAGARDFVFSGAVQTGCGPTQPPVQWVAGLFPMDEAAGVSS